jgi:hypothetical protein
VQKAFAGTIVYSKRNFPRENWMKDANERTIRGNIMNIGYRYLPEFPQIAYSDF